MKELTTFISMIVNSILGIYLKRRGVGIVKRFFIALGVGFVIGFVIGFVHEYRKDDEIILTTKR